LPFAQAALCAFAALSAVPAFAQGASHAAALDREVEALKREALDIGTATQRTAETLRYPAAQRLTVDVSVARPQLRLHDITLTIDDGMPVHRDYSSADAAAFGDDGLDRLLSTALKSGTHRLQAEVTVTYTDAKPGSPPVTGSFDQSFDKTDGPEVLELKIDGVTGAAPTLSVQTWRPQP
jgi:hypothetical protein